MFGHCLYNENEKKALKPSGCDVLCIDANALVYISLNHVVETNASIKDVETMERDILAALRGCLMKICQFCGNPNTIFVAFDGVAPWSKVNRQRYRRFEPQTDRKVKLRSNERWDKTAFTPGTSFMKKLDEHI